MLTGRHKRNHCHQTHILANGQSTRAHIVRPRCVNGNERERERSYTMRWSRWTSPLGSSLERLRPILKQVSALYLPLPLTPPLPPPNLDDDAIRLTLNDSTYSDPCLERTTASGGIKPLQQQILRQWVEYTITAIRVRGAYCFPL